MTDQSAPQPSATAEGTRADRFHSEVAELDVPVPSAAGETRLLYGGIGLVLIGAIVIFVGYWGASGTASVAEQMPYMLSGGALGLAFVIVGAFLVGRYSMAHLFRFWLARLIVEQRTQTDRLIEAIREDRR